jgi:hypothetical protein
MDFNKYKNQLPYPPRPAKPTLPKNPTPEDYRKHADNLEAYEKVEMEWLKEMDKYHAEQCRLESLFKADALAEVGLTNHPKADKAYGLAWKNGHSGGYSEVYYCLLDYAELLKD